MSDLRDPAVTADAGRESADSTAPPVVAVVVVHDPGDWFDVTLDSLRRQDHPNFNTLFLVNGSDQDVDAIGERIRAVLPESFIRLIDGGPTGGPGFGPTANIVLDVVDGDTGFFAFCHDDVALAPDAIRLMVEELYRSNAGIVGPKLVDWDQPNVLEDIGLDVDHFGAPGSRVEPGEYDQQQHDQAGVVFAVPSACMLVRADLFRALDGFDTAMRYHGEDVELCWRARLSGARVAVAPAARVRHRGELALRRPDINHEALRARNQLRTAMTLSAGRVLPLRMLQLLGLAIAELVVGTIAGRVASGWASLRALAGGLFRFPGYLARRGTVAKLRRRAEANGVAPAAISELQAGGSFRLRSLWQERSVRTLVGVDENVRRWRERSLAPVITWVSVIVAVLIASRTFINSRVPVIGEFLPFPASARTLWSDFLTAWNPTGLGATSANPTGLAVLAAGSVTWLFVMTLGMTALVTGLILLGGLGVWRLADLFPSNRERVVALIVYVAMPLLPGIISTGRLGPLVAYAAVPWFVHLVRTAVGISTADPATVAADLPDGLIELTWRERLRRTAFAAMATALAVAIAPPVVLIVVGVAVVMGVTTLISGAGWRTAAWLTGTGLAVSGGAWLLNLPWAATWSWNDLTAVPLAGAADQGLAKVATMDIGNGQLSVVTLAWYLPVITGLLLAKAWRLTWAARAAGLVVAFFAVAVLHDRNALPFDVPEAGYLLVPVALGLAIAAACAVASFASDVAGGTFGWRQPLGLLSVAAVAVGLFPSLLTLTDGSWYAPSTTLNSLVRTSIDPASDPTVAETEGDFRVLYLGDPRLLPGAPSDLGDGVAMILTAPGEPDITDRWLAPETPATEGLTTALDSIAANATQRGGRLLAPYAVRYIVVPVYDGAVSTPDDPLVVPAGLLGALGAQLDLELRVSPPNYVLYENHSVLPAAALLTGDAATVDAAGTDNAADLVQTDLSGAPAPFGLVLDDRSGAGTVEPGVVHLSVPFDEHWTLSVDGTDIPARPGFGVLTAFDVATAGTAELHYDQPASRRLQLLGQAALWILALVAASHARLPRRFTARRQAAAVEAGGDGTIDLDHLVAQPVVDTTGPVRRLGRWRRGGKGGDATGEVPRVDAPVTAPVPQRDALDDALDDDGDDWDADDLWGSDE